MLKRIFIQKIDLTATVFIIIFSSSSFQQ